MNWKTLVVGVALSSTAIVGCNNTPAAMPCGNGTCDSGETTATCAVDCPAPPVSRTYVVSTIDTGEDGTDPTMAFGFDLDMMIDGAVGLPCTAAPDFTSAVTGDPGVDNQLSTVLPTLGMMLANGVNGAIQEQIQGGTLLLMFEVGDINSFTNDSSVTVHILLGMVPAGATIMTSGTGLVADQTFTTMMDIATVTGSITAGRLSAMTTTLPLSFAVMGSNITLTLRNVVIGGRISDGGGFAGGEFGAIVAVTDVVTLAAMFIAGVDLATVEALAMPDIMPDATGDHCASISAGLGFETVSATLE